ncbi:MAG: hypothetical protein LBG52_07015 [Candidatus Peribacteria bacterium]|jgi:hypothetical protein|nr:hypothetical protein [Candidatus Peribacteria bacterium]
MKIKYAEEAFLAFLKFYTKRMCNELLISKDITMDKFRERIQALLYYNSNARYSNKNEYERGNFDDIMKIINKREEQKKRRNSEHQTKQKRYKYRLDS